MELRLLLLDLHRPRAREHLNGWLGESEAGEVLRLAQARRYLLITTIGPDDEARYMHLIDCLDSVEALTAEMIKTAGHCDGGSVLTFYYSLDPAERDRINRMLDEHALAPVQCQGRG